MRIVDVNLVSSLIYKYKKYIKRMHIKELRLSHNRNSMLKWQDTLLKSSLKHKCWTIEKQLLVMDKSIINERPNCFESINEKLRSQRSMYKQMMGEYLCNWFQKVHKKKVEFMKVCFLLSLVQSLTYLYTMGITFFLCSVACKAARV